MLLSVSALFLTTQAFADRDGAKVYGTFCIACHSSGVSGAPKTGDAGRARSVLASLRRPEPELGLAVWD